MAPTSGNPTIARSRITDTGTARAHDLTVTEGGGSASSPDSTCEPSHVDHGDKEAALPNWGRLDDGRRDSPLIPRPAILGWRGVTLGRTAPGIAEEIGDASHFGGEYKTTNV